MYRNSHADLPWLPGAAQGRYHPQVPFVKARDLKPANIFQKGDVFKIGDFGFSKQLWEATSISPAGSPLYMSLELLNGKQYTSKCDIWALGFIFYELLHGETPWRTETMSELIRVIEKTPLHIRRTDLSANTIDFIEKCLQKSE